MKILYLILKSEWYDKIESGEKTIEYRESKPYWDIRLNKHYDAASLRRGYTKRFMIKPIIKIEKLPNGLNTDLKIDKPVYAIYIK